MHLNNDDLMDYTQTYIIEHVEHLLIELANDVDLTYQELKERAKVICQLLVTTEAKTHLLKRLALRDEAYFDHRMYQPIIDHLFHSCKVS